ncbi:hypothetical protein K2173_000863 [Erythroxylum novogranatense]|uniref:Hcy-binding domain-containing protein n=1 Tax=Erythroxylum novogranatense TaxID=1862640 RepID=A0AAV8S8C0_9ROSI|nr:hypothetical protein K2173_000863 [Erythroxylum novogranatense]
MTHSSKIRGQMNAHIQICKCKILTFSESELDSAIKAFVTTAYSLLEKSVEIACDARVIYYERCKGSLDGNNNGRVLELHSILVAASVGSYGAYLDFHHRRVKILTESRADLIAFETNPNKDKISAYPVLLEDEGITIPAWFFNSKDGINVVSFECASIAESYKQVVAVGTNCTPPRFIQVFNNSSSHYYLKLKHNYFSILNQRIFFSNFNTTFVVINPIFITLHNPSRKLPQYFSSLH